MLECVPNFIAMTKSQIEFAHKILIGKTILFSKLQIMGIFRSFDEFGSMPYIIEQHHIPTLPVECILLVNQKGVEILESGKVLFKILHSTIVNVAMQEDNVLIVTGDAFDCKLYMIQVLLLATKFFFNSPIGQGLDIGQLILDYKKNI